MFPPEHILMDWTKSPDVESRAGVVSGAYVVKGTRVPADAVIDNAEDGFTAEETVTDLYPTVPLDRARRIIGFAGGQIRVLLDEKIPAGLQKLLTGHEATLPTEAGLASVSNRECSSRQRSLAMRCC
jgi:uncharacterized protein (DUF433 family)